MSAFTMSVEVALPYPEAVDATRRALSDQGFGILTEIDLREALKTKLGVDVPPEVILGACRPELAHEALQQDPSVAALLPCNVVVRHTGQDHSVVEAFDPSLMESMAPGLHDVALDARGRLQEALRHIQTGDKPPHSLTDEDT